MRFMAVSSRVIPKKQVPSATAFTTSPEPPNWLPPRFFANCRSTDSVSLGIIWHSVARAV